MFQLQWVLMILLPWAATFPVWANEDCPGKQSIEFSGNFDIPKKLSWGEVEIPDLFIVDVANVKSRDQAGIDKIAMRYGFPRKERITAYTTDGPWRAGVVYSTDAGSILAFKLDLYHSGSSTCTPGSSINVSFYGLPASLNRVHGMNDKKRCMWNLEVPSRADQTMYSFKLPIACDEQVTPGQVLKMLAVMRTLMPKSVFPPAK